MIADRTDVETLRRWYAEDLRLRTPIRRNPSVADAFAAVPRERFLGPGPWKLLPDSRPHDPFTTPDDRPHWLYHDVLVAIDPARALNNGLPSFWAHNLDHLDLSPGERVLQVGAGTGYYSALLAEIVGPKGRVVAVEHDTELAARARGSLKPWPQVEVVAGDGRTHDPGEVDATLVFAGSTHPAPLWLDRLAEGGRLMMPLTAENWWGFVLRSTRRGHAFDATQVSWVGIFPCAGGRDAEAAQRLLHTLQHACRERGPATVLPIHAVHRGDPTADVVDRVWYHAPGFWIEREPRVTPGEVRAGQDNHKSDAVTPVLPPRTSEQRIGG
jgi:protein-L-isoaspartate(D-aspartate) O-methyltransferase